MSPLFVEFSSANTFLVIANRAIKSTLLIPPHTSLARMTLPTRHIGLEGD